AGDDRRDGRGCRRRAGLLRCKGHFRGPHDCRVGDAAVRRAGDCRAGLSASRRCDVESRDAGTAGEEWFVLSRPHRRNDGALKKPSIAGRLKMKMKMKMLMKAPTVFPLRPPEELRHTA